MHCLVGVDRGARVSVPAWRLPCRPARSAGGCGRARRRCRRIVGGWLRLRELASAQRPATSTSPATPGRSPGCRSRSARAWAPTRPPGGCRPRPRSSGRSTRRHPDHGCTRRRAAIAPGRRVAIGLPCRPIGVLSRSRPRPRQHRADELSLGVPTHRGHGRQRAARRPGHRRLWRRQRHTAATEAASGRPATIGLEPTGSLGKVLVD